MDFSTERILEIVVASQKLSVEATSFCNYYEAKSSETLNCMKNLLGIVIQQQKEISRLKLKPTVQSFGVDTSDLGIASAPTNEQLSDLIEQLDVRDAEVSEMHHRLILTEDSLKRLHFENKRLKRKLSKAQVIIEAQQVGAII